MAGAPGIRVAFLIEYVRVEAAGDAGPWRQQAILGRGRWDADALRDIVRDYPRRWPSRVRLVYRADAGRASAKGPSGRTLAAIR